MRKLILVLLLCAATVQAADKDKVYRYTDSKGVIHYTDKPPAKDAKPVDLPPLQTFPSTGAADLKSNPVAKIPPQYTLAIISPEADATYRDADASVSVAVSTTPAIPSGAGFGYIYSVDGAPQNDSPLEQTSFSVSLERGTHTISVALRNGEGQTVASSSVNVHIMPPTVKH